MSWAAIGSSIVSGANAAEGMWSGTPPASGTSTGPIAKPIVYKNTGETEKLFGGSLENLMMPLALGGLLIFVLTQM